MLAPLESPGTTPNRAQRRTMEKAARRQPALRPRAQFASQQEAYTHLLKPLALLSDCRTYEEREIVHDLLRIRAAYDRLKDGGADQEDFNRVAVAINLAKVRAMEISEPMANEIEIAQDAMMACKTRYQKHGRFGFDGPSIQAMDYAVEAYEVILSESSPKQMENAMFSMRAALQKQTAHGQQLARLLA